MSDYLKVNFSESVFKNELSHNLITSFFPFTKEEVLSLSDYIDFSDDGIYKNPNIIWDVELIEQLGDKFNFNNLWYLKDLKVDIEFIEKFEKKIDFPSLYLIKNLVYSDKLIFKYGKYFDKLEFLLNKEGFTSLRNIRKFSDRIKWTTFSRNVKFPIDIAFLKEFTNKINWDSISLNPNLKLNLEMLEMFKDRFNFNHLCRNKASAEIILKYPKSHRWNWEAITHNEGIVINAENLSLICRYYANNFGLNPPFSRYPQKVLLSIATTNVISKLIQFRISGVEYLFNKEFSKLFVKHFVSKSSYEFPVDFFIENLHHFDLKEGTLLNKNGKHLTPNLIAENILRFDLSKYPFYRLPITNKIIEDNLENINFLWLSGCESIEWSWDFIEDYSEHLNINHLTRNEKAYLDLLGNLPRQEILKIFNRTGLIKIAEYEKNILNQITQLDIEVYLNNGFSVVSADTISFHYANAKTKLSFKLNDDEYYNFIYLVDDFTDRIAVTTELSTLNNFGKYSQFHCFFSPHKDHTTNEYHIEIQTDLPNFIYSKKRMVNKNSISDVLIFKESNILKYWRTE